MNTKSNHHSTDRSRRSRLPVRRLGSKTSVRLERKLRHAWREGFAAAFGLLLTFGLWNSHVPRAHADEPAASKPDVATEKQAVDKVEATGTVSTTSTESSATPVAAAVKTEAAKTEAVKDNVKDVPRTLSVEPNPERRPFTYDKSKRPAWVDQIAQNTGESQFKIVMSGPRVTDREAQRGLDEEIAKVVRDYVGEYLDSPMAAEVLPLSVRDIKARMRSDQFYTELVEFDIGPMYMAYALVEFNPEFRADLEQRWQNLVSYSRIATFGVGFGAIVLVLGSLLTYLRVDTATRGYYTRRLQLAAVTTILAIVTAGVVLARHFFLI